MVPDAGHGEDLVEILNANNRFDLDHRDQLSRGIDRPDVAIHSGG